MELNGDGNIDILSGSYSRPGQDMAGLFHVLWGDAGGTWRKPEILKGSDGEPLILPQSENVTDRICTRPFVVDYDGDGKLDIVAGNFGGTFGLFRGEGDGKFAPTAAWLEGEGGKLSVEHHGDPFFVDWDGDGDLDLLSGASSGGVFLFRNVGSRTEPKWAARTALLEPTGRGHGPSDDDVTFGEEHLKGPAGETRVWVDDVDGDGRLDLLVGDQVTLLHLAKGVDAADARTRLAAWKKKQREFFDQPQQDTKEAREKWTEGYKALEAERDTFARQETTGFVWLIRQQGAPAAPARTTGAAPGR